jgi:hypothetical protein
VSPYDPHHSPYAVGSSLIALSPYPVAASILARNQAKNFGLGDAEFQAACREDRRATSAQANARLQQAKGAAVSTLIKIMVDANAPAATRLRAADSVMNHARQTIEIEDVKMRLAALEQAAELSGQER